MENYLVICWGQILIFEYTVWLLQVYWCSIDIFQTFSIDKGFFVCFLLTNCIIVVFEKFFDFPIQWQASISLLVTFTSILSKIPITYSSRFWSSTSSGIPVISRLFLGPYCSKELLFSSCRITFFSRFFICFIVSGFQPVNLLLHPLNLALLYPNYQNVITTYSQGLDISRVLFSCETNKLCQVL